MKYIIVILTLLLGSCSMFYDVEQEVVLTDEEITICKDVYLETITFDNIYYANNIGNNVNGLYFLAEDKILIVKSDEDSTIRYILHELMHRYQYKKYNKVSEDEAYMVMSYIRFIKDENYIDYYGRNKEQFILWLRDYVK